MRVAGWLIVTGLAWAQGPDPAYQPLAGAYEALRIRDYDRAVAGFLKAIEAAPERASIRNDLAYTYLKIGESELAREQFGEALRLDPADSHTALEYAFLCYETKQQVEARRIFDRLRRTGNAVAEQAFQNIDAPLAAGIEQWKQAIALGADNFSVHFELATLAEQRDELELAAEHYQKAWRILPDRRSVLVALGRVWKQLGRLDDANAALLAASRGGEPRAAELARELLPDRYPYVPEFRRALAFDPANTELRRELGYLLLRMDCVPEAEQEFRLVTETAPEDLLSATQLGFLLYARGDSAGAQPLFDHVLAGGDQELANRVRAVLHIPQVLAHAEARPASIDAKVMAERSLKAGYTKDALKYLQVAHENDPADAGVLLELGWTHNILHQDAEAVRWFGLARHSGDPLVAAQAARAWRNLRSSSARFRTTVWMFPIFSTRWRDLFSYGQIKTEVRTRLRLRPYVSLRFIGDTRQTLGASVPPQYLSESSFIVGAGMSTVPWRGITAWAEAGSAAGYLTRHLLPDYRGGVSVARNLGSVLGGEKTGVFLASTTDGVFISRFGNDRLLYQQIRFGYTAGSNALSRQLYWNANMTLDAQGQGWANFIETGPGIRFRVSVMPRPAFFTLDLMEGAYLIHASYPQAHFRDVRAGLWYAFTH